MTAPADSNEYTVQTTAILAERHHAAIDRQKEALTDWQTKRMPFIQWFLAMMAIAIFATALVVYMDIVPMMKDGSPEVGKYAATHAKILDPDSIAYADGQAISAAVAYRTARRHDRADATVLLNGWLRFAGFMTGAALVFAGALFVIGKFVESPISLTAEHANVKASLTTASPGLYAMTLGALVIFAAIAVNHPVKVRDETLDASQVGENSDSSNTDYSGEDSPLTDEEKIFTCGENGLNPEHKDCADKKET